MRWQLYDYIDSNGGNSIKEWVAGLQKKDLAKLNSKLDMLENYGPGLPTGLLTDTKEKKIREIVVNGEVAIRLLICRGPIDMFSEFTLLFGAFERDREYVPKNALKKATECRKDIINDPQNKRCKHERITKK